MTPQSKDRLKRALGTGATMALAIVIAVGLIRTFPQIIVTPTVTTGSPAVIDQATLDRITALEKKVNNLPTSAPTVVAGNTATVDQTTIDRIVAQAKTYTDNQIAALPKQPSATPASGTTMDAVKTYVDPQLASFKTQLGDIAGKADKTDLTALRKQLDDISATVTGIPKTPTTDKAYVDQELASFKAQLDDISGKIAALTPPTTYAVAALEAEITTSIEEDLRKNPPPQDNARLTAVETAIKALSAAVTKVQTDMASLPAAGSNLPQDNTRLTAVETALKALTADVAGMKIHPPSTTLEARIILVQAFCLNPKVLLDGGSYNFIEVMSPELFYQQMVECTSVYDAYEARAICPNGQGYCVDQNKEDLAPAQTVQQGITDADRTDLARILAIIN